METFLKKKINKKMDFENKQLNDEEKALRTYTSDMADAIRQNEVSVIKIALAEKEKREQENIYKQAEGTKTSKIFFVIGGIILISVGLVGSYYLFQKKETVAPIITNNFETFINYDLYSAIDVTNITNQNNLINVIEENNLLNVGQVEAIFLSKKINELEEKLNTKDFLSLIESSAPGTLVRSLSEKYLLGEYITTEKKSVKFLIFETNNYAQTYASMLEWEKTLLKDLFIILNLKNIPTESPLFEKPWKDVVINNRDARVLYGESGEGILYYVFINKNHFVITSDIETLKEVISKLILKNSEPE
jgi:hypothetical protein